MHEAGPLPNHGARVSIGSWFAWGAATLFVLYQLATQNSIAAMQVALEKDLAISEVEVGIVSATFLFVYAVMQIPAGMLLDRWRPQFLLPPAALGVAGAAWLLSISGGFWGAVGARALMGAFAAFAFSSWMSFQIVWDRKNKNVESIKEGQSYLSTKIVTDLVKVIGECLAIIITITGTVGVIVGLLSDAAGEIVGSDGIFYLFMFPVIGYCILVGSKFMSETVIALTDIAQNTKK